MDSTAPLTHSPSPTHDNAAHTLFLSLLFVSGGFGVLSVQVYLYYLAFPNESWWTKLIVYTVYTLELVQTILVTRTNFRTFVYGFMDLDALDLIYDLWFSVPIIGGTVACIVQLFYAHRIVLLGKYLSSLMVILIAGIVIILSLAQMAGGIALGIQMVQLTRFSDIKTPRTRRSAGMWLAGEGLCDIIIAVCMTHILLRSSSEGMRSTRSHARRVIRLTIETGALTAAIAIVNIILVMDNGRKLYYQASVAVVSKLYSNTLLVSLNSRISVDSGETYDMDSTFMKFGGNTQQEVPTVGSLFTRTLDERTRQREITSS